MAAIFSGDGTGKKWFVDCKECGFHDEGDGAFDMSNLRKIMDAHADCGTNEESPSK